MRKEIDLSIVIPVYNSQHSITIVVNSLMSLYNHQFLMEIILVNDASIDNSKEECEKLKEQVENVIVIHHEENGGQQAAILTGLRRCNGQQIVLMDDDMQNPPHEVIKLINKLNEGYDVVIAKRESYNQSWIRKNFSIFFQILISLNSKDGIVFSNFLIMQKAIAQLIIEDPSPKPIIQGIILKNKVNIANIRTEHHQRVHGKSNYSFLKIVKFWLSSLAYLVPNIIRFILLIIVGIAAVIFLFTF